MKNIENKIYFTLKEKYIGTLIFPKCNIITKAFIGRNGLTYDKIEGDGKTPIGEYNLGIILGSHSKEEVGNVLNYQQITNDMYWIDDVKSKYYNQLVDISKTKKDWNSAEHLIDYSIQYEYLVEIKTNPHNIPGKGSAIFLHCSNNKPTAGCIAVDTHIMRKIIQNIDCNTKINIKN